MERVLRSRRLDETIRDWIEEVSSDDSDMSVDEEEVYQEIDSLDWYKLVSSRGSEFCG